MTSPRALLLLHETDNGGCLLGERLRQRGFDVDEHVVCPDYDEPNIATPFPDIEEYDVLIPMGSIRSLTRRDEIDTWIDEELHLIRTTHQRGMPILGICFGGQLLAAALGGSVELTPVTEIGWREIEGENNPIGPGPWMQWHHDRFIPPPEAEILARNDTSVQLIRIGRSVGTQFHPEVDLAHVETWLEEADDDYLEQYGVSRERLLDDVRLHQDANRDQCFALVDWFLDEVAFTS